MAKSRLKAAVAWLARHRGALLKIALSILALMVILFLPLRTDETVSFTVGFAGLPDTGTLIDNQTVAVVYPAGANYYSYTLNTTWERFAQYGGKLRVYVEVNGTCDPQAWTGGESVVLSTITGEYRIPLSCADGYCTGSGTVEITAADVLKAKTEDPTLDLSSQMGFGLEVPPPTGDGVSVTIHVEGGATVRKPLYTGLTEPIASAFSALWGALLGLIRRARSVMNSALGGFWAYFGISAFTGNIILALALAALALYVIHYKHIFRRKR